MKNLRFLRKLSGITMKQLGEAIGVAESTVSLYENDKREPDNATLSKLADYFGVSVDYLLGRTDDPNANAADKFPAEEMLVLPVYATVAAGFNKSIKADDYGEVQHIPLSVARGYDKESLFVYEVSGDSMVPKFLPGDRVLVVKQDSVDSGDIAIVCYNDYEDGTIKKVMYEPGCKYVDLIPTNAAYSPVRLQGDDLATCRIVGKVIYLFRRI